MAGHRGSRRDNDWTADMTGTIKDLWHVGFVVRDVERAVLFYRDVIGLALRHRQTQDNQYTSQLLGYDGARVHVAQFDLPNGGGSRSGHILELIEYEHPRGEECVAENARITAGHLAFEVDDLDAVRERIEAGGGHFYVEPVDITAGKNQGGRAVYFRDPDGVTLELLQPPPSA